MISSTDANSEPVVSAAVIPLIEGRAVVRQTLREEETRGLVEALGSECAFVKTVHIRNPSPSHLFSSGLLENIRQELEASGCELFVVDGDLTPIQQRNLERYLSCKVIDRTGLILEIFGLRARTKAGRLQVETARLAYERSRLVRTWTHLERQRGGRGFIAGPGETQIESDRRMIDGALLRLKKQLSEVERTRNVQRSDRKSRDLPVIALVGYTNAGKSTLFNTLSSANVFAKDMPFATLDPTIRAIELDSNHKAALVDTVGFITDLPTSLIESFKGTLEEAVEADIILHVHDASSPDVYQQSEDVIEILDSLEKMVGTALPPIIDVWNKIDRLDEAERDSLEARGEDPLTGRERVFISATTGTGLEELKSSIKTIIYRHAQNYVIRFDTNSGDVRSWLYRNAEVFDIEDDADTMQTTATARLDTRAFGQLNSKFPNVVISKA